MDIAFSIPDGDRERFEHLAARYGLTLPEFLRLAGQRLADEWEGGTELTSLANAAMVRAGQPAGDGEFLRESESVVLERTDW